MQYFLFKISQLRLSPTLEMTTEGKVSVRFGRKERKATEWRLFAFKRNCANYKSFSALPLIPLAVRAVNKPHSSAVSLREPRQSSA